MIAYNDRFNSSILVWDMKAEQIKSIEDHLHDKSSSSILFFSFTEMILKQYKNKHKRQNI